MLGQGKQSYNNEQREVSSPSILFILDWFKMSSSSSLSLDETHFLQLEETYVHRTYISPSDFLLDLSSQFVYCPIALIDMAYLQ